MVAILNNHDNIHKTETQQFRLKDILTLFKSLIKIMYGLILKLLKFRKLKCFFFVTLFLIVPGKNISKIN